MRPFIWPVVERVIARSLPARNVEPVLGDLLEDHSQVQEQAGWLAELWLLQETMRLAAVYRLRGRITQDEPKEQSMTGERIDRRTGFLVRMWQRKWWMVAPALVAAAVTYGVSSYLPKQYASTATVLAIPPRVSADLVNDVGGAPVVVLEGRLSMLRQEVLGRTRLEALIVELDLFPEERKTKIMEDVIERMRRSIQLNIRSANSFTVGFIDDDPRTAQRVADRLTTIFVDASLRDRESLAEGTHQFLEARIEDLTRRLNEHDRRLAAAKAGGVVPTALALEGQVLQETYKEILHKREEASLASDVQRRQIGGQFRVLEPPRLPIRPTGRSAAQSSATAAIAGLAVGFVGVAIGSLRRPRGTMTEAAAPSELL